MAYNLAETHLIKNGKSIKLEYLKFFSRVLFNFEPKFQDKDDLVSQVKQKVLIIQVQVLLHNGKFILAPLNFASKSAAPKSYLKLISSFNKVPIDTLKSTVTSTDSLLFLTKDYKTWPRAKVLLADSKLLDLVTMTHGANDPLPEDIDIEVENLIDDSEVSGPSIIKDLNNYSVSRRTSPISTVFYWSWRTLWILGLSLCKRLLVVIIC